MQNTMLITGQADQYTGPHVARLNAAANTTDNLLNYDISRFLDEIQLILQQEESDCEVLMVKLSQLKAYLLAHDIDFSASGEDASEQRREFQEKLRNFNFNQYTILINKISECINSVLEKKKHTDIAFYYWLQDKLIYSQVLAGKNYGTVLEKIRVFRSKSKLSLTDKLFRFVVAFNSGIGSASVIYTYGPAFLIGLLTAMHVILPPLGVAITGSVFAIFSLIGGIVLLKSVLKIFSSDDKKLNESFNKSEDEVYRLAEQETELRKSIDKLNHKNSLYRKLLGKEIKLSVEANTNAHLANEAKHDESTSIKAWLPVAMTFFGTLGAMWGIPKLVLSFFGVSLVAGSTLAAGPILGVALSIAALSVAVMASLVSYKYHTKSERMTNELEHIKEKCLGVIRAEKTAMIAEEGKKEIEKRKLKTKVDKQRKTLALPDGCLDAQMAKIEEHKPPIHTHIELPNANTKASEVVAEREEIKKVQASISSALQGGVGEDMHLKLVLGGEKPALVSKDMPAVGRENSTSFNMAFNLFAPNSNCTVNDNSNKVSNSDNNDTIEDDYNFRYY